MYCLHHYSAEVSIFWKELKNQNKSGSQGTDCAWYRGLWSDEFPFLFFFHKFHMKVQDSKIKESKETYYIK